MYGTVTCPEGLIVRTGPSTANKRIGKFINGTSIQIKSIVTAAGGWTWAEMDYWIGPKKTDYRTAYSCIQEPGVSYKYITITSSDQTQQATTNGNKTIGTSASNATLTNNASLNLNFGGTGLTSVDGEEYYNGSSVARENLKLSVTGKGHGTKILTAEDIRKQSLAFNINYINEPKFIQNNQNYPSLNGFYQNGMYKYDYTASYAAYEGVLNQVRNMLNIPSKYVSNSKLFSTQYEMYNRFKQVNTSNELVKSFAHVFFVRPDLNILDGSTSIPKLTKEFANNSLHNYILRHSPKVLSSLVANNGQSHDFMMLLSNSCRSFSVSDEYIKTDSYGDSWLGYKMPFGRHDVESKVGGTIDMSYVDDRELHLYMLHKIWMDYIARVYRGQATAKDKYRLNKILDYATCLYYIVTAENGEDIIFWSKYYGIFPTNTSSSSLSWSDATHLSRPQLSITYSYAWKRDYDPLALVEFNKLSSPNNGGGYKYLKTYNPVALSATNTYVGAPFIESVVNQAGGKNQSPYIFKLRFMPE